MASDILNQLDMVNGLLPNEQLIVGGQPSINDLEYLKAQGVETVINLRPITEANEFEESKVVENLGLEYCHIPLSKIETFTKEACEKFQAVLEKKTPCLAHCATGNRVGALMALSAYWLEGTPLEQAIEFGKQAGLTMLEPQVRSLLATS